MSLRVERYIEVATVEETRKLSDNLFLTRFRSPKIASCVSAGQFVMASFDELIDPLLPRAFSVCDVSGETLSLFYAAVGKGTTILSQRRLGDAVVLNGPLGKGFPEVPEGKTVWIIVGGSGVAVIPILVKTMKETGSRYKIFCGARTAEQLVHFDGIASTDSTDDGSSGYHGTVVDLVKGMMTGNKPDKIFACGPTPMLRAVQKGLGEVVETFLSVEAPMACGMGFCQGCPVRKKGSPEYFLACKDGPVFRSDEIDLV